MEAKGFARIALVLAEDDKYSSYYKEVLAHAGVCHELIGEELFGDLSTFSTILLCGYGSFSAEQQDELALWVSAGGTLVCSGSDWGLGGLLGVAEGLVGRHPNRERVYPTEMSGAIWPDSAESAVFFGGCYAVSTGARVAVKTGRETIGVSAYKVGKGSAYMVAPHVGQTVAQMQVGRSVEANAIGPADGSFRLDNCEPSVEDGINLSYDEDRISASDGTSYFGVPHADIVKELWIRTVLEAVEQSGKQALIVWYWPKNADGVATVTVDCEEFSPDHIRALHHALVMHGARACFLVATPGYSMDVYRAIRRDGHQIGLLFQADGQSAWTEEKFKIQHVTISRSSGLPILRAGKMAGGRWRGLGAFYELAEATGTRVSLTKGGRQQGTTGFLYGTCHPFFPHRPSGGSYRTLEMPPTIFQPGIVAKEEPTELVLAQTAVRGGCAVISLTSCNLRERGTIAGLIRALSIARSYRLAFMLPEQIFQFEQSRRALSIKAHGEDEISLLADQEIEDLTVLVTPRGETQIAVDGKSDRAFLVKRFGRPFQAVTIDLEKKIPTRISLTAGASKRPAA